MTSETWARDFNEIKAVGGKASTQRSPEQTEIARFWDYSLPPVYHGVVRSVALPLLPLAWFLPKDSLPIPLLQLLPVDGQQRLQLGAARFVQAPLVADE